MLAVRGHVDGMDTRRRLNGSRGSMPLRKHGGGQWDGWAPWPGPYGPGEDQDGFKCPCPDVHGLGAPAYGPLIRVDIPSAHPDT